MVEKIARGDIIKSILIILGLDTGLNCKEVVLILDLARVPVIIINSLVFIDGTINRIHQSWLGI